MPSFVILAAIFTCLSVFDSRDLTRLKARQILSRLIKISACISKKGTK